MKAEDRLVSRLRWYSLKEAQWRHSPPLPTYAALASGTATLRKREPRRLRARERHFKFEPLNANYCDFCFSKLMGGEYDRLRDGRERCVRCARTVVATSAEFADVFTDTRRNLETAFGITTNVGIAVHMVNAREIARRTGEVFQPTPGVDAPRCSDSPLASHGGYALLHRERRVRSSRRSRPSPMN